MNEEYQDIFTTTACPTQQQLLDYVEGRLSAEQQHEVELHLADCEMCSEAVEGLSAIGQKEKIPVWLRQMKWEMLRKLRTRKRRKTQVSYYTELAIIVIVVLFIILGAFWTYHFMTHK
ncbi:anti-sigma factor [Chitinophaga sp. S165]|uniref:anti-sigma factor family protein n=1 Tax=Chitinophaga sp. S165 TaxID=2135462 RepID=UPI000D7192D1|nr:zf-HC2 domain-containing protein [Chitinophaga sp. S165]PWV51782.1 putative zinc finger protein [Chitinophaga sp. S165]